MDTLTEGSTVYASFWRRLGGILVDVLIFLPFAMLNMWLDAQSRTFAVASVLPWLFLVTFYHVYFHARWGQTPGKMAVGIKVVSLDGSALSWRQSLLCSSVDAVLLLASGLVTMAALLGIPAAEYGSLSSLERGRRLSKFAAPWRWLDWLYNAWFWIEVVVMLTNEKRRALHDFLAGTVVVKTRVSSPKPTLVDPKYMAAQKEDRR